MSGPRQAVEDALQSWLVTSSGYAASKVIWKNQDAPRPTDDFIEIKMGDWVTIGAFDQLDTSTDLTRPQGQEVALTITGWREFTLTIECFTQASGGDAGAHAILTQAQVDLGLPSVRAALSVANVTPSFERGTVRNVPQVLGTSRFEGRAIVEINFYTTVEATEYTGYIDEVTGTGTLNGTVNQITGEVPLDFLPS